MKTNRKHGFTIVELVVVIAIIAVLAAVLIPTFASIIKKANDSAYLQERTSQQIEDLAEKVENQNYLTWEDFEAVLARELAKVGSTQTEAIENAVKVALAERAGSDNGLSEAQVQKIINEAMSGQLTTAQVQAIVEQSIKNAGFSVGTSGGVTAAQVKSIVSAAIANIPTQTGVTPAMVQSAVASALENAHITVSQDDIEKALKAFGVPTATEVETLINSAVAAANIGEDDISDVKVAKVLNYRLSNTDLTPTTAVNPTVVFDALSISNPAVAVATTSGNIILWDSANNRFVVVDGSGKFVYSENATEGADVSDTYKYWTVSSTVSATYSTYYTGTESTISTTKGFDAGTTTSVTSVTYTNSGSAQDVVIRTNSFGTTLTINAPADTVNHYGNAAIVNVEKIAEASYHENGTVGRLTVEEGHAVAEANATIFCFIDAGSDTTATVEVKSGAVVYDNNGENNGQAAVVEAKDDCGAGHHDFGSQLVIDNKVYEVCKSCGYTLVHVVDEVTGEDTLTTKVDSTNNVVNTPVETFNNSTDSVNEDGTVKVDAIPSVAAIDASNINTSCSHEFGDPVVIEPTCYAEGSKTYTCTKCGSTMTTSMAKTAHRFYDDGSAYEKCLYHAICHTDRGDVKVAKIGNTEYRTLRQAIADITDNTPTTITMIADEAIYGNAGYTIAVNKNITIDLNGHTIKNFVTENKASALLTVRGTLTIKDSSDTNKDGTGYGIIYNDYDRANENIHVGEWWGTPQYNYATNVITNSGTLTIESGRIYQTAAGSICYAVDNNSTSNDTTLNVNGGLISDAYGTVVRMFCNSTTKENIINVNGGSIVTPGKTAIWTQLPGSSPTSHKKATLNISGGNVSGGTYAWYDYSYGDGWDNVNYSFTGGELDGYIYSYGKSGFVTGGTFSADPSAYVAEGYAATNNGNGTWTVVPDAE